MMEQLIGGCKHNVNLTLECMACKWERQNPPKAVVCEDCLALAKIVRDYLHNGTPYVTELDLDAFIKARPCRRDVR